MHKVIFVGGTSYSGSTLLDMILSNDPKGYSLGEITALFRPFKSQYLEERKKILASNTGIWNKILREGSDSLYPNLIDHFGKDVDFFVDSSKNPFWIQRQTKVLKALGVDVKNILIYKEKPDLAKSFKKRNRFDKWEKSYIKYHIKYAKLFDEFYTISYKSLTQDPKKLEGVCEYLGIPYVEGKEEFWNNTRNSTFFGNDRTRFHNLKDKTTQMDSKDTTEIDNNNDFRKIYYYPCKDESIIAHVAEREQANSNLGETTKLLEGINLKKSRKLDRNIDKLKMKSMHIFLAWLRFNSLYVLYKFIGPLVLVKLHNYKVKKRLKLKPE